MYKKIVSSNLDYIFKSILPILFCGSFLIACGGGGETPPQNYNNNQSNTNTNSTTPLPYDELVTEVIDVGLYGFPQTPVAKINNQGFAQIVWDDCYGGRYSIYYDGNSFTNHEVLTEVPELVCSTENKIRLAMSETSISAAIYRESPFEPFTLAVFENGILLYQEVITGMFNDELVPPSSESNVQIDSNGIVYVAYTNWVYPDPNTAVTEVTVARYDSQGYIDKHTISRNGHFGEVYLSVNANDEALVVFSRNDSTEYAIRTGNSWGNYTSIAPLATQGGYGELYFYPDQTADLVFSAANYSPHHHFDGQTWTSNNLALTQISQNSAVSFEDNGTMLGTWFEYCPETTDTCIQDRYILNYAEINGSLRTTDTPLFMTTDYAFSLPQYYITNIFPLSDGKRIFTIGYDGWFESFRIYDGTKWNEFNAIDINQGVLKVGLDINQSGKVILVYDIGSNTNLNASILQINGI